MLGLLELEDLRGVLMLGVRMLGALTLRELLEGLDGALTLRELLELLELRTREGELDRLEGRELDFDELERELLDPERPLS